MQAPVRVGDIVSGKYRVDGVLGAGGMGVVVAAHHLQLEERVALKFLLDTSAAGPTRVERFMREARTAAKLRSDHVVRIRDVGQLDSGVPYMVMEHLEGRDLEALIEESGALTIAQAVDMLLQACEAIAEAHSLGVVHRDLKPSNLFVVAQSDGDPFVKVLDFGISKLMGPGVDAKLTETDTALGSPLYMSPEQMMDASTVDTRTDIWACGVILYEMLAGRPPFVGTHIPEISVKVATKPHVALKTARPDVPDALSAVVDRALAKAPMARYSGIVELARALAPFGASGSAASLRRIEGTSAPAHAPTLPPTEARIDETTTDARLDETIDERADTAAAVHVPAPSLRERSPRLPIPMGAAIALGVLGIVGGVLGIAGGLVAWREITPNARTGTLGSRPEATTMPAAVSSSRPATALTAVTPEAGASGEGTHR